MNDSRYRGGGTRGGRWGCAMAALVGFPVFAFATLAASLGDCMPGVECHPGFWLAVGLPTLLAATPVGFGVRWLVNRYSDRDR